MAGGEKRRISLAAENLLKKRKAYQALKATQAKQALLEKKEVMVENQEEVIRICIWWVLPNMVELDLVLTVPSSIGSIVSGVWFIYQTLSTGKTPE